LFIITENSDKILQSFTNNGILLQMHSFQCSNSAIETWLYQGFGGFHTTVLDIPTI